MKKLIIILLLPLYSFATTRYIAASGNDATGAGTQTSPYKSPDKCASVSSSGDVCLLNLGDTFAPLTATISGLHWDTYGTGARPIFSGLETTGGWVNQGGGIWSFTDAALGSSVNLVTINGVPQPLGRFPKSGYNQIGTAGTNSITDPSLTTNFNGGEIVIRARHWVLNRAPILSQSSTTINYGITQGDTSYRAISGWGYFIQNQPNCLSLFGDWYYNPSTNTLYMYFGASAAPTSYTIKVSKYSYAANLGNFANNTFNNINFEGGNLHAVFGTGDGHQFTNCGGLNSGGDDLQLKGANYTITHCQFKNANNNGIILPNCHNCSVTYCSVVNCGTIPGAGGSGDGETGYSNSQGIEIGSANPAISYNNVADHDTIINCGYVALRVNGESYNVTNNYVNGYCLILDDGGAYYTYNGGPNYTYTGRTFQYNFATGGGNPSAGTNDGVLYDSHGIYLDDNSNHTNVLNNTISGSPGDGIFIHNSQTATVNNNTVQSCFNGIHIKHDGLGNSLTGLSINNNIVIPKAGQTCTQFYSPNAGDITTFGTMSNNTYYNLYGNANIFMNSTSYINLSSWQSATGTDSGSVIKIPVSGFSEPRTVVVTTSGLSTINWLDSAGQLHLKGSYIYVPPGGSVVQLNVNGVVFH